jgi:hypothetical protein
LIMATVPPRTARDLTHVVREIQQRLPRRKRPSLPAISMERPDGKEAAALAKARLQEQGNLKPVAIPERREIVEEIVEHVSAGVDRTKEPQHRALTRAEKMHREGTLSHEEWQAAGVIRNRFLAELGHSEGVAGYGDKPAAGAPWEKADRRAQAILRNRTSRIRLAELVFAACGLCDEEGNRIFDQALAADVVRCTIETVNIPTLTDIGARHTAYTGARQQPAAGGATIKAALKRAAAHLGYVRLPAWKDGSWRVVDSNAAK